LQSSKTVIDIWGTGSNIFRFPAASGYDKLLSILIGLCQVSSNSSFSETLLFLCSRDSHKHHCYSSGYSNTQWSSSQS